MDNMVKYINRQWYDWNIVPGKRYKSEDIYSDDRSVIIIVDDKEKLYVSQLNSQIDNFFERKTELVQTLEKMTALLRNYIVRKYELDAEFMVKKIIH